MPQLYDPFVLSGGLRGLRRLRSDVVGQAHGRMLALGAGTGLNMKYYSGVERLVLSEPEPGMAKRLDESLKPDAGSGEVVSAAAEPLPFGDGSFDAVVATMVFCTASDPHAALREMRRVRAPCGACCSSSTFVATPVRDSRAGRIASIAPGARSRTAAMPSALSRAGCNSEVDSRSGAGAEARRG